MPIYAWYYEGSQRCITLAVEQAVTEIVTAIGGLVLPVAGLYFVIDSIHRAHFKKGK